MNKSKFYSLVRLFVFLIFGIALFYYIFHSQQEEYRSQCLQDPNHSGNCSLWSKLLQDTQHLDKTLMLLVMCGFIISNLMRARRWVIMLETLGIKSGLWETFWAVQFGYFANLALPRMGEFARAGSLSRRLNAPLEKVLGTIISDRLLDVFVLMIFICIGLLLQTKVLFEFLSEKVSLLTLLKVGIAGIFVFVFFIYLLNTDRFYHPIIEKIKNRLSGLKDGIVSVVRNHNPMEMILLSFGIWIMYYSMTMLGLKAFTPTSGITLVQGLIVFIIGSVGMAIPTPGGIGSFHFLTMTALGIYGISRLDGFSYANLSFILIQIMTISIFGIIGMTFLSKSKRVTPAA